MSEAQTSPLVGVRLTPASGTPAFRVARTSYGPLNPAERHVIRRVDPATGQQRARLSAPLGDWNRWDTVGRTIYLAESAEAAYAEALAPYRRRTGSGEDPLEADAAAVGMTLHEFLEQVEQEWSEACFMRTGNLPASWRHARALYAMDMPSHGYWIDITHGDTLAAIDAALGQRLVDIGYPNGLTVSDVLSDDRELTVRVATLLRDHVLEDGSEPLGVIFPSKRGFGACYAYWMRRADLELEPCADEPRAILASPVSEQDPNLVRIATTYGIHVH